MFGDYGFKESDIDGTRCLESDKERGDVEELHTGPGGLLVWGRRGKEVIDGNLDALCQCISQLPEARNRFEKGRKTQ